MILASCDPKQNQILNSLNEAEFAQVLPHLELMKMTKAEILFDADEKLHSVYFPTSATVALTLGLQDGSNVSLTMVGNESVLGISAIMGENQVISHTIISSENYSYVYRISLKSIQSVFGRSEGRRVGAFKSLLLSYMETLMQQISQVVVCDRRHHLVNKLCTWLLLYSDLNNNPPKLSLTQDSISYILGVHRESITEIVKNLHEKEIITCSRGQIELSNRIMLENNACECYQVKKKAPNTFKNNSIAA